MMNKDNNSAQTAHIRKVATVRNLEEMTVTASEKSKEIFRRKPYGIGDERNGRNCMERICKPAIGCKNK